MGSAPAPATETATETGTTAADLTAAPTPPSIAELHARDVPCVRCRYSLIAHDERGRCPECGFPAHWSLRAPTQLSQYPAKWVAAMAWGTRLLVLAYGALFVVLAAGFASQLDGVRWVAPLGFATAAVLQLGAALMLARRSRHWSEPRATVSRLVLLTASGATVVAGAIGIYMEATRIPQPRLLVGVTLAALCGWVVAPPAVFFRIRSVARMIADARLARYSAIAAWGMLTATLAMAVGLGVAMALSFNIVENLPATVAAFATAGLLLCFLLWGAFVLLLCARDFGRAARVARHAERDVEPS